MLKSFLKQLFSGSAAIDPLVEGATADQYHERIQDQIRQDYYRRWAPTLQQPTPSSHPWLFDPCEPPQGWSYDPYHELWIKLH